MNRERLTRNGGWAAMLGGSMYMVASAAVILIYFAFAERTEGTFVHHHAFIHAIDAPTFALLALGAIGVYLSQSGRLGRIAKAGFFLTLTGFGLSALGGLAIIAVGLTVGEKATLGVLDVVTHPLAHLLFALGSLAFGIALLRKGDVSKLGSLLAAVGPIALLAMFATGLGDSAVLPMIPAAATGLGWILLGYGLRRDEPAPPKVSEAEAPVRTAVR